MENIEENVHIDSEALKVIWATKLGITVAQLKCYADKGYRI